MRRFLRQITALSALSALAACDGTRSPLAPADAADPEAGESTQAVVLVPGEPLAALTTSKILFMSWNAQERSDVVRIDPQGTALVNLTNTGTSSEYDPAWSYDHKRIAFVRP